MVKLVVETPFSGHDFHALPHSVICFLGLVASKNTVLIRDVNMGFHTRVARETFPETPEFMSCLYQLWHHTYSTNDVTLFPETFPTELCFIEPERAWSNWPHHCVFSWMCHLDWGNFCLWKDVCCEVHIHYQPSYRSPTSLHMFSHTKDQAVGNYSGMSQLTNVHWALLLLLHSIEKI